MNTQSKPVLSSAPIPLKGPTRLIVPPHYDLFVVVDPAKLLRPNTITCMAGRRALVLEVAGEEETFLGGESARPPVEVKPHACALWANRRKKVGRGYCYPFRMPLSAIPTNHATRMSEQDRLGWSVDDRVPDQRPAKNPSHAPIQTNQLHSIALPSVPYLARETQTPELSFLHVS